MSSFNNFEFAQPIFLWGLITVPLLGWWYWKTHLKRNPSFRVATSSVFPKKTLKTRIYSCLKIFKTIAVLLLWVALARPRNVKVTKKTNPNKGIDIVMAIDVSSSMLAKDLKPDRLNALKKVAVKFVQRRPNDRIGIVVYAGESFTKTPVTTDKRIVIRSIAEINYGLIEDGTAIGMGLGSAVNRLEKSNSKSRIIILLTDGVNNSGLIDPITATELAKDMGIKVYTIAIGTNGMAPFPYAKDNNGHLIFKNQKVEIDETLLKKIAKETGGLYFRATDNQKLQQIYNEIDQLETSEVEEFKYYNYQDFFRILVILAMSFWGLSFVLQHTIFTGII